MPINYSDGQAIEAKILRLLKTESQRTSQNSPGKAQYDEWAVKYHLCPERSNLLRPFSFTGLNVLELGAGMGGLSRYLAEEASHLTVVEGTQPRFDVLKERLKGLTNWDGHVENFEKLSLKEKVDVVTLVGVWEYSELYLEGEDPFLTALEKVKSFLKPDGVFVLSIENKLGLKYFAGAHEDHLAKSFDGICGYPSMKSAKTFSLNELKTRLKEAGFSNLSFYYPFPDYKIPKFVISQSLIEAQPGIVADLAGDLGSQSYTGEGHRLYPEMLAWQSIARGGLISEMAPSFLIFASCHNQSTTLNQMERNRKDERETGWGYEWNRKTPVQTTFYQGQAHSGDSSDWSRKRIIGVKVDSPESSEYTFQPYNDSPVRKGEKLQTRLVSDLYYKNWDGFYRSLSSFLQWSFNYWQVEPKLGTSLLKGEALDAIYLNASIPTQRRLTGTRKVPQSFELFDLEWKSVVPITKSWFVFRNVFGFIRFYDQFNLELPVHNLKAIYLKLCMDFNLDPHFELDTQKEASFQSWVYDDSIEIHKASLIEIFEKRFAPYNPPQEFAPNLKSELKALFNQTRTLARKTYFRLLPNDA